MTFREDLHLGHDVALWETDDLSPQAIRDIAAYTIRQLEDRLAFLQYQIDAIAAGGIYVNVSVSPETVVVGVPTQIAVTVVVTSVADSITLLRNDVQVSQVANTSTLEFTDTITAMQEGAISYEAVVGVNGKSIRRTAVVNAAEERIPDYYIGWAKGDDANPKSAFTSLTTEQLVALSTGYMKASTPSVTKTVTAGDVVGSRQVFFIMYKTTCAPQSGVITSAGMPQSISASDFLSPMFDIQNGVMIDDTAYNLVGMRGPYDAGDSFTINF